MKAAEQRIAELIRQIQARALQTRQGREREAIIEIVRSLDHAAFAFCLAPNRSDLIARDAARHAMLVGAATALRPFLEIVRDDPGGVPWGPSNRAITDIADGYLINCGELAALKRIAAMERYGVAEATFLSDDKLVIEVAADDGEQWIEMPASGCGPR
jgi:hypothetical protein